MTRSVLLLGGLLMGAAAKGQNYPVPQGPDLEDLHARLKESAYVVRGKVLSTVAIAARAGEVEAEQLKARPEGPIRMRYRPGGALSTVAVEAVLCQRGDFNGSPTADVAPSEVRVFVPSGDLLSTPSKFSPYRRNRPELLLPGGEYLLFLVDPPGQDAPVKAYNLEPGLVYYRTVEGERGAVRLPDAANPEKPRDFITPLVQAVTTFCEAMKGPDAATKIRQLQAVRDRFDYPAWRQSVDRAIQELQGPPRRLP